MSSSSNPLNSSNPSNLSNSQNQKDSSEQTESIFDYAFEVIADIFLGVVLGVSVNAITDFVARELGLPTYAKLALQFTLIIIVLYILKIDSKYLYSSWKGQTNYGIVFTAVFFAVQKNMLKFLKQYISKLKTVNKWYKFIIVL